MFKLAVIAFCVAVAAANFQDRVDYEVFKAKYNKKYSGSEESERLSIYLKNKETIRQHNILYAKGESTYYLGENEYADMTTEEFVGIMNGLRLNRQLNPASYPSSISADLPTSVDWRTKGYVTPIKNQGQCGSCWAFSTTGSLEGAHFKSTGKLVSLSESNLVDCSSKWGNMGCNGGLMDQAFQYVIDNKGIDTEKSYPYEPETRSCHFKSSSVGSTEKAFTDVESGSEAALQKAIAEVGPISVAIDASHGSFQLYSGGIYNEPACSSSRLDHGVLAVGYGSQNGADYYIVKNSWGTTWGDKGYILMSRNKDNQCGIATMASYPTV